MIYSGDKKTVIYKGDFHPAQLYKGNKKIAGYSVEEFEGVGGAILATCYNDSLHNVVIHGNSIQDGTPSPEAPIEIQSVGELVTEGDYAGKYKICITAHGENGESESFNTYLDEPLRKIGEYADYIDFKKAVIVRNVAKRVFDGTEGWIYENLSYGNNFYTKIADAIKNQNVPIFCNMGRHYYNGSLTPDYACRISSSSQNFNFRYQDYNNLQSFVEKLKELYNSGNPLYTIYILSVQKEASVTLPKLTELPTFKGTTIYEIDTQIPATISGKYKRTGV